MRPVTDSEARTQQSTLHATCLLLLGLSSACATTIKPDPAYEGAFVFHLTPEQCERLSKERRNYRATEQTASYVAGAGALVSVIALGLVDAKTVPAVASSVSLLAGGTLAFAGSQVGSLDDALRDGGCGR